MRLLFLRGEITVEFISTFLVLAIVIIGMLMMTCVITTEEAGATLALAFGFFLLAVCGLCIVKALLVAALAALKSLLAGIVGFSVIGAIVLLICIIGLKFRRTALKDHPKHREETYE